MKEEEGRKSPGGEERGLVWSRTIGGEMHDVAEVLGRSSSNKTEEK